MRVLITGASGFAGRWLCRACLQDGDEVIGVARSGDLVDGVERVSLDLRDGDAVAQAVARSRPEVVYHLAAMSAVGRSWTEPRAAMEDNAVAAASLLEALRTGAGDARVVWVSSSEVYGTAARSPIPEAAPLSPESPYAVSKLAGEQLAAVYARAHGLAVVVARAFAHAGPEQRPTFLLSSITSQAARARRRGERTLSVRTGNPDVRRDVTDVRDVVRAYRLLARSSRAGVVNVCSGTTRSTAEQVAQLGRLVAPIEVQHVVDPALVRGTEVMELRGDPGLLRAETGWEPEIAYEQTVSDLLEFWDREMGLGSCL
jgi:GDP-4-dehydro-6-deoxy-D-mannose reductase